MLEKGKGDGFIKNLFIQNGFTLLVSSVSPHCLTSVQSQGEIILLVIKFRSLLLSGVNEKINV